MIDKLKRIEISKKGGSAHKAKGKAAALDITSPSLVSDIKSYVHTFLRLPVNEMTSKVDGGEIHRRPGKQNIWTDLKWDTFPDNVQCILQNGNRVRVREPWTIYKEETEYGCDYGIEYACDNFRKHVVEFHNKHARWKNWTGDLAFAYQSQFQKLVNTWITEKFKNPPEYNLPRFACRTFIRILDLKVGRKELIPETQVIFDKYAIGTGWYWYIKFTKMSNFYED